MEEEVCRACLSAEDELTQFDKVCIDNYYLLTNVTVDKVDGLPQQICWACKTSIDGFITFRAKCIESETFLNKISNGQLKECDEQLVKEELLTLDDNYSDNYIIGSKHKYVCFNDEGEDQDDTSLKKIKEEIDEHAETIPKKKVIKKTKAKNGNKDKSNIKPQKKQDTCESKLLEVNKHDYYMCGLCPSQLPSKPALSEHIGQHLQNCAPCEICSEAFTEWQEMAAHRYKHLEEEHMMCHLCFKKFKMIGTQENHYYKLHSEKGRTGPRIRKRVYTKDKFICDYCDKGFSAKQKLMTHVAIHMPREKLPCSECGKNFSCKSSLKFHRKNMHSSEGEYCTMCQKRVPELETHQCARRGVCPICGKRMATHFIARHMVTHTAERPYKCTECPNSYRWQSSLDSHLNKHRGLRPHRCPHCPMGFYTFNVLQKHMRTHTGERPYVCEICGKGFTGSHNLKMHMKVHGQMVVTKKSMQVAAEALTVLTTPASKENQKSMIASSTQDSLYLGPRNVM